MIQNQISPDFRFPEVGISVILEHKCQIIAVSSVYITTYFRASECNLIFFVLSIVTDVKPTVNPSMESTRVSSGFVRQNTTTGTVKLNTTTGTVKLNTTTETATTTSASIDGYVSVSSTAHTQTIVVTSLTDHPQKFNVVVTALVALAAALFVVLATVAVIFLLWRRKRYSALLRGSVFFYKKYSVLILLQLQFQSI